MEPDPQFLEMTGIWEKYINPISTSNSPLHSVRTKSLENVFYHRFSNNDPQ